MEVLDRTVNDLHDHEIGECSYFYEPNDHQSIFSSWGIMARFKGLL